jgi:hypothetical protein
MTYVCVFDVNETLLDLSAMDPGFQDLFGDASVRRPGSSRCSNRPW